MALLGLKVEQHNEADEKLQLWDSLGDEVEVFVPTVWNNEKAARALFVEPKDKEYVISLVFLKREEAERYREARARSPITFVKISLGRLYVSFGKYFGKSYSKK